MLKKNPVTPKLGKTCMPVKQTEQPHLTKITILFWNFLLEQKSNQQDSSIRITQKPQVLLQPSYRILQIVGKCHEVLSLYHLMKITK